MPYPASKPLRYEFVSMVSPRVGPPRAFVVIDQNPEGTALLVRTLQRKFPGADVLDCVETDEAIRKSRTRKPDAIVVHRPIGMTGEESIRVLRKAFSEVPIVMVSSVDRSASALAAGASSFLHYDAWLMLGSVVEDLVKVPGEFAPWSAS